MFPFLHLWGFAFVFGWLFVFGGGSGVVDDVVMEDFTGFVLGLEPKVSHLSSTCSTKEVYTNTPCSHSSVVEYRNVFGNEILSSLIKDMFSSAVVVHTFRRSIKRQRQAELHEFEANLVYKVIFRTAKAT